MYLYSGNIVVFINLTSDCQLTRVPEIYILFCFKAQPRFPAPIQRPAVTQPGNGKPMKLSGNQVGVSSVETYSSQGKSLF